MRYEKFAKDFWNTYDYQTLGSTSVAMYLYLIWQMEKLKRKNFSLSDSQISKDLGIRRNTVKVCRDKLRASGLLDYEIPKGGSVCYDFKVKKSLINNEAKEEFKREKKVPQKSLNVSSKINITKPKSFNRSSSDQIIESHTSDPQTQIPTFLEFLAFAKTVEFYESNLENLLKEKYIDWVANSWKNNLGKPITNWKLSLKNAVPFLKNNPAGSVFMKHVPKIEHPEN